MLKHGRSSILWLLIPSLACIPWLLLAQDLERVPLPGELLLRFAPGVERAEAEGLLADYGLSGAWRQGEPSVVVAVPVGQETVWQDALLRLVRVAAVERRYYYLPKDKYVQEERRIQPVSKRWKTAPAVDRLLGEMLAFFAQYARDRKAQPQVLHKARLRVQVQLSGLRGEVIGHRNYWEQLQVSAMLFPVGAEWEIVMILEGSYASGIGGRQPGDSAFQRIEKGYPGVLGNYAKQLITRLQTHLEQLP